MDVLQVDAVQTAFRPGDVVIVRMPGMSEALLYEAVQRLRTVTERTGVHFVVLGSEIEVVEARRGGDA